MAKTKSIRITDPVVISLVEAEAKDAGDTTPTSAAGRLIIEYSAILKRERSETSSDRGRGRRGKSVGQLVA